MGITVSPGWHPFRKIYDFIILSEVLMSDLSVTLNLIGAIFYAGFLIVLVAIIGKAADNIKQIKELLEREFGKNGPAK